MVKKIFLTLMSHCDLGYTDFASQIKAKHITYITEVINLCAKTENYPEGQKFKWTCEESWEAKQFLEQASAAQKKKFFHFVRNGQIEIGGFIGGLLTELPSYEELIRSCEYAIDLAAKNKFSISTVILNDVPGITGSLPEILLSYNIRYFLFGPNTFRNRVSWTILPRLFYLMSRSGEKVLMWHIGHDRRLPQSEFKGFGSQYGYGDAYVISPYRSVKDLCDKGNIDFAERSKLQGEGKEPLKRLLKRLDDEKYPYDAILLQCSADNRGPDSEIVSTVRGLNDYFRNITFVLATPSEFFRYMENKYKKNIPSYSGELVDAWSDGAITMSRSTSLYRECQRKILVLEKILALSHKIGRKHIDKIQEIYENLLYYSEHTFGLSCYIERRPSEKNLMKSWKDKSLYVEKAKCLIDDIEASLSKETTIYPSNFSRDVSYDKNCIENLYYKVKFSSCGKIESIFDKELKKELVNNNYRFSFNELIFTAIKGLSESPPSKGCGITDKIETVFFTPLFKENRRRKQENGAIEFVSNFELSNTPIKISGESKTVLYPAVKRIDFFNTFNKEENRKKEALYFSFPFNLESSFKTYFERAYNLLEYPDDLLSGSHNDFIAIQHFAVLHDTDLSITWVTFDAPLVEVGDIQTNKWNSFDYRPENPILFSYIMHNLWPTNCSLWQGGKFTFRYSITSHKKFQPSDSYEFTQQVVFPEFSDIEILPKNIVLTSVHINPDKTVTIRLFETSGNEGIGQLKWQKTKAAYLVNLAGEKRNKLLFYNGKILFPYRPYKLLNILIIT